MTAKQKDEYKRGNMYSKKHKEMRMKIAERDLFICQKCGKYLGVSGCLADRINQSKMNRKKYGNDIIDHNFNKVYTCVTNSCNDVFNIGNKPETSKKLVKLIIECGDEIFTVIDINRIIGVEL